jgi:hypothetical protein
MGYPEFTYDNLNRMATAQSQATTGTDCWGNSYGYDRYGNLLTMSVTKCTAQSLNVTVNTNNQIVGFTYDAAGNLLSDGSKAYTWDAENRPKTAAGTAYTFDGTNARVKKGTNDFYWFSAASCKHPLFGRSTSAGVYTDEYVHFNGQPVGYRDDTAGAVYHIVTDEAGSVRAMTNSTGVKQFESDYYPQGSQRVITATKDSLLKFQAKQLDTESGLENAARLYNPATARFLSVAAKPAIKTPHPQALNKVSAPAATPLNSFTSSVGSILSSFRSSLSSYRQCAQTVWGLGLVSTNGHEIDDGWVEILCGVPEFNLIDPNPSSLVSCKGILSGLSPIQGLGCAYLITCFEFPPTVGEILRPPQICRACFFQPCPITASLLSQAGDRPITPGNTFFLEGFPNDFCHCSSLR